MQCINIDILPVFAQKELLDYYEYLKTRYMIKPSPNIEHNEDFKNLLDLRKRLNPLINSEINIDDEINQINNDIF